MRRCPVCGWRGVPSFTGEHAGPWRGAQDYRVAPGAGVERPECPVNGCRGRLVPA